MRSTRTLYGVRALRALHSQVAGYLNVSHHRNGMSYLSRKFLLVLLGWLCSASLHAAPWFIGEFRGAKPEGPADMQMSVTCNPGERCKVLATRFNGTTTEAGIPITAPPKALDPAIPNNNLETTRERVTATPDWYKDPSYGPILTPIRSFLQSQERFSECVDLDGTAYFAMCSLSTDREGRKSVVFLMSTMNGSCGRLPYCAYYFLPLERVR